jgi:hypothetical protein
MRRNEAGPGKASRRLDPTRVAQNIVQVLQSNPVAYKRFGIWWWFIKGFLKGAGYTCHQLWLLEDYIDPEVAAMVPDAPFDQKLQAALRAYQFNSAFPHSDGRVENEDGDLVMIYDADAGI